MGDEGEGDVEGGVEAEAGEGEGGAVASVADGSQGGDGSYSTYFEEDSMGTGSVQGMDSPVPLVGRVHGPPPVPCTHV